jgi:4'-phosphopantetheinyl transferase
VLADDACDLWCIDLEGVAAAGGGDPARSPLDASERERAARFVFERHRRWYTAARTALRGILGAYLGLEAAAVAIEIAPLGRPRLASTAGAASALEFNLSHCDALALVAVARRGPLGVDVEQVRPMPDALALAERHFVADEIAHVAQAQGAARDAAFFTCWTRKEAVLKSTGVGLSVAPCTVRVGATAEPLPLDFGAPGGVVPLVLHSLQVRDGAIGACAFAPGIRLGAAYRVSGGELPGLAGAKLP